MRRSLVAAAVVFAIPAHADVITDWNRFALPIVQPQGPVPGYRALAIMNVAMFQAVNTVEPRHQPYQAKLDPVPGATKEAAAAVAAARILARLHPEAAAKIDAELKTHLDKAADGAGGPAGLQAGVTLGEKAATQAWDMRAHDGSSAPDTYRPRATPGKYVSTAPVAFPQYAKVAPFTMKSSAQFRPKPPLDLKSEAWARNYNEIKQYGKASSVRTPEQTEVARFWMMTGPITQFPIALQLAEAGKLDVNDCARLFALLSVALADAGIAVFDAKYHYEFWRPVTAIRNGDRDDNPKTERDAAWEPIGPTPLHPEYPCAHCITSAAAGTVLQAVFGTGTVSEFSLASTTLPGVTRRWTHIEDYMREPSNARIWAGIHYRFSTEVGYDMGVKIGEQAVRTTLRPL